MFVGVRAIARWLPRGSEIPLDIFSVGTFVNHVSFKKTDIFDVASRQFATTNDAFVT